MTAILGMHYVDGLLMFADTEESLGGGAKSECDKLYRFIFADGTVVMGGAGDSHLIECANQELHQFFAQGARLGPKEKRTLDTILKSLNKFAAAFVRDTAKSYRGFSLESVPGIEMLIAVNLNRKVTALFRWRHSRVVCLGAGEHASVGSGDAQLSPLLRDVQFSASKECMLFHGVRMMYHAKRGVSGVGGRTEALALQNDGATHYFGTNATKEVEDFVVNYERFKTSIIDGAVTTIAATDPLINEELEANVKRNWNDWKKFLMQYRNKYKAILKPQLDAQK